MNQEADVFQEFMTDTLCFCKLDGRVFQNVKASVAGKGIILIEDVSLPIEIGDRFTRVLPSGVTEEFIVDDPGYHAKFSAIAAHYQVKVHRAGTEHSAASRGTTYNVSGPNARLNVNSHDHSTNAVTLGDVQIFAELRRVVAESVAEGERAKLLAGIDAMEKTHTTPGFVDRYATFMALAANHMTIIAPLIPALSALLTGH